MIQLNDNSYYEEEYYESPDELFGVGDPHDILVSSYIKNMLEDEDVDNGDKRKLREIVNSTELQDELLAVIYEDLNNSNALCNYSSDFSVEEIGKMDGPWNTVMDIVNESIGKFLAEQPEIS